MFLFLYIREEYGKIVFNLIVKNANVFDFIWKMMAEGLRIEAAMTKRANGRGSYRYWAMI
ncbi:MAG TPA: hypothetical protein DDZ96_09985 [Porphyromonadaceae bacterium]|nr:hypothetical protein [Porphyromonadaceae bacterium]